jgi:putative acetyltransferase
MMHIRPAQGSDAPVLMQLFYDTVHRVNCRDYSPEQIEAWAPALTGPNCWQPRFSSQWTFVAAEGPEVIGFCELERDGHVGCFYCHYQHQRQGVGSSLLKHVEAIALQHGIDRLQTEASITAKPFFERHRFQTLQAQTVERHGVMLLNYRMAKSLEIER